MDWAISANRKDRASIAGTAKRQLSPARRAFLQLMQAINFGRIEKLRIVNGEPLLDPRPVIVREIKLGGENGPRTELSLADFLLKKEVIELFSIFDEIQDGVIDVIEVRHGLPFRVIVREGDA